MTPGASDQELDDRHGLHRILAARGIDGERDQRCRPARVVDDEPAGRLARATPKRPDLAQLLERPGVTRRPAVWTAPNVEQAQVRRDEPIPAGAGDRRPHGLAGRQQGRDVTRRGLVGGGSESCSFVPDLHRSMVATRGRTAAVP